jgi:2-oxo-4-hydroxy-4-carboxy--5-ureidoimidazoline (OHCU) decarboxylase
VLVGRAFASWDELIDEIAVAVKSMTESEQVALANNHPRIGAPPSELLRESPHSWAEQGGSFITGAADVARLDRLNASYEERFGFRFVEWVGGRPIVEIIPVLEARLEGERSAELAAGLDAMVAIARDRLTRQRRDATGSRGDRMDRGRIGADSQSPPNSTSS